MADPITPSRAAAFSNSIPDSTGVEARVDAVGRVLTNVSAFTPVGIINTVPLDGTYATRTDRMILLAGQTDTTQNGLYVASSGGAQITVTGSYDGSGNYVKTGLITDRLYHWTKNTAGTSITNGTVTLTESGFISAKSTQLTLKGTAGASQLNFLVEADMIRAPLFDAPNEFPANILVRVNQGPSSPNWWRLSSMVTAIGTSPITFEQVTIGNVDNGTTDDPFDNTAPANKTPGLSTAWDNTSPSQSSTNNSAAFDNTAPGGKTPGLSTAWDNTPPTANVLQGETSPVAGITTPASPIIGDQSTTLVAGSNYLIQIGSRASIVTINLPDPGSLGQRIEIADIAGLGLSYPILVNAGSRTIFDTLSATYTMDRNAAVLALTYTGTAWKIL